MKFPLQMRNITEQEKEQLVNKEKEIQKERRLLLRRKMAVSERSRCQKSPIVKNDCRVPGHGGEGQLSSQLRQEAKKNWIGLPAFSSFHQCLHDKALLRATMQFFYADDSNHSVNHDCVSPHHSTGMSIHRFRYRYMFQK